MTTITALRRRVEAVNIPDISQKSIEQTEEQYTSAHAEQMKHGLRADGSKIGEYQNEEYAVMKHAMNPLAGFGNMDLKLTGAFHKSEVINVFNGEIISDFTDSKAEEIKERVGDVSGLGGEFKQQYVDDLRPVFMNNVKDDLKL